MRSAVLWEAVVFGALCYVLASLVYSTTGLSPPWLAAVTAGLMHVLFEVTGGNEWFCKQL